MIQTERKAEFDMVKVTHWHQDELKYHVDFMEPAAGIRESSRWFVNFETMEMFCFLHGRSAMKRHAVSWLKNEQRLCDCMGLLPVSLSLQYQHWLLQNLLA